MKRLTHIGSDGRAQMVDVSAKPLSSRTAVASGKISLQKQTADLIRKNKIAKGNVVATARIAGIQAAKQTAHLIPLCHTIPLSDVKVEMEALTGVAVALLAIYDMCKAVDKEMEISEVRLVTKEKRAVAAVYPSRR